MVYADSTALSMQALIPPFRHVPRAFFTVIAFVISTVAGVAGRAHFSAILTNFLAIVGGYYGFYDYC
jgi:purine-cytosine permease-like protein